MVALLLLALSCCVSGAFSGMLGPCKKEDKICLQKSINEVFHTVFGGIPSRGVDSIDHIFSDIIEGNLSVLKFTFRNTTTTNFKNCAVKNSEFDVDALKLYFEMDCSNVNMMGDYEISGKLIAIPVQGKGTFKITASKFLVPVNAGLKINEDKDGKSYVNIKNFKVTPKATGPLTFQFDNLFNGQKDLSDAVHKFAHENYMEVAELVQNPIFNACVKPIIKNINKFLKTEPLAEIFIE